MLFIRRKLLLKKKKFAKNKKKTNVIDRKKCKLIKPILYLICSQGFLCIDILTNGGWLTTNAGWMKLVWREHLIYHQNWKEKEFTNGFQSLSKTIAVFSLTTYLEKYLLKVSQKFPLKIKLRTLILNNESFVNWKLFYSHNKLNSLQILDFISSNKL